MNRMKKINDAFSAGKICVESRDNLLKWISSSDYSDFLSAIDAEMEKDNWKELDDMFYKIIEFGTGGRRGPQGPGPNRINKRTIGESAQGLADYIHEIGDPKKGTVIAFDTRHGSREFAREVACVLAANGIPVFLYSEPRSTPQLSFSIRFLHTQAGCMISASHNPPSDNGIKVSWSDGGQVLSPHDKGIIEKVTKTQKIKKMDYKDALDQKLIQILDDSLDEEYLSNLVTLSLSETRGAKIAYSPLHGVGATNVVKLLNRMSFDLVTVADQMIPDPDFRSVKNQLPNPELPAAMERVTELASNLNAAVAMASDPDADRLGLTIPCPKSVNPSGWMFVNGNQIGVLILDHVLRQMKRKNLLKKNSVVIKTIVTTEMLDAICADYGVEVIKDLLVGFKYIAEVTERILPEKNIVFTTEESHGYNRGTFVRDKDSAPAALHIAELACLLAEKNETIYQHLNNLYRKYGYYCEITKSVYYHGKSGRDIMLGIMDTLRQNPPREILDMKVDRYIDRSTNDIFDAESGKPIGKVNQHTGNVMIYYFDKSGVNRITARPSGTEPKIKFYAQLHVDVPEKASEEELEILKKETQKRADALIAAISNPGS